MCTLYVNKKDKSLFIIQPPRISILIGKLFRPQFAPTHCLSPPQSLKYVCPVTDEQVDGSRILPDININKAPGKTF